VEVTGNGLPVLFIHEFAGDLRQWERQVRAISRTHCCITYNARGYPPSDVPEDAERYSQDIVIGDALAVLSSVSAGPAHIVGHSMGAYTALHLGIRHPGKCLSVVAAGVGFGSDPSERAGLLAQMAETGRMFRDLPMAQSAERYAAAPMRAAFARKDPRGFAEFVGWLSEHSPLGHALTMENLQMKRPTLQEMADGLKGFAPPLLVIAGDEDFPCIEGSLLIKRLAPQAGLLVMPHTSHMMPTEEPETFTAAITEFIRRADTRRRG
jgi:pimeloyl-ACP methyl ester carboxylesterase